MGRTGQQMRQRTLKTMKQSSAGGRTKARKTPDRNARLRYWFDGTMARGTSALVVWLAVVTLVLILVFTVFILITQWAPENEDGSKPGFFKQLFNSLMHALDPGTVAGDTRRLVVPHHDAAADPRRPLHRERPDRCHRHGHRRQARGPARGRSLVIERDHTVILGWSDSVFAIVRELSIANESRRRPAIVILAEHDKVEMEDEVREKVGRTAWHAGDLPHGSPLDLGDLVLVQPQRGPLDHRAVARRRRARRRGHQDPARADPRTGADARASTSSPRSRTPRTSRPRGSSAATRRCIVDKRETIARLIVQTSRQSGAAAVYTELFDFDGDEIYFHADPTLAGRTFAEALSARTRTGVGHRAGRSRTAPCT